MIVGTYFLQRAFNVKILTVLLTLTALGFMGDGIFTNYSQPMHFIGALVAFLFDGLSAIYSYKLMKLPFSLINVLLGLIALSASVLNIVKQYLGLGAGEMERIIVYPILIWTIGFGSYLIAFPKNHETVNKFPLHLRHILGSKNIHTVFTVDKACTSNYIFYLH